MTPRDFSPGFRFSALDAAVLLAGGVAVLAAHWSWIEFVIAFVVAHFFLFCNVFRLSRPLEFAWAAVFVSLASTTVVGGYPGWVWTAAVSLGVAALAIAAEMRRPSYHGVGWQTINPGLPAWWAARQRAAGPNAGK